MTFLGFYTHTWLEYGGFYLAMVAIFLVLRRLGLIEGRFEVVDISIRVPLLYIGVVGGFRLLTADNHGCGYGPWVLDCVYLSLIALAFIRHRPKKAVLGILCSFACLAFFYELDYYNVWTDYEWWTERHTPGNFKPPYGPHRWWWEQP